MKAVRATRQTTIGRQKSKFAHILRTGGTGSKEYFRRVTGGDGCNAASAITRAGAKQVNQAGSVAEAMATGVGGYTGISEPRENSRTMRSVGGQTVWLQ